MSGSLSYSFLLGIALKSAAILAIAALAALGWRDRSAALRHTVWITAFAALLSLPPLAILLPAWRVPVNVPLPASDLIFQSSSSTHVAAPLQGAGLHNPIVAPIRSASWSKGPRLLMVLWVMGAALGLVQMLIGWMATLRLQRRAKPMVLPEFASLTRQLGITSGVKLWETAPGSMPITFGLFRTAIFLPSDASHWSAACRRVVLLHELAHVRRGDTAMHLLARTALCLYWWNPLAWIAWREFLREREQAADDLVLGAGESAPEYACHLLEVARSMRSMSAVECAAVPMARRSQLEGRLMAILDSNRDRSASARVSPLAISLLAIGMVAPMASVQAQSDTGRMPKSDSIIGNSFSGLIQEGDVAREQGQFEDAKKFYRRALAASGSESEKAAALVHLGITELATKDTVQALSDFELAQAADAAQASIAEMWMAVTQQHQNNFEAAAALYRSAIASEDPRSAAAATTMELYAQSLQEEGKTEEAKTMRTQAAAIREEQVIQTVSQAPAYGQDVYRVGGDITPPQLLSKLEPSYTQEARIAKYQGSALLSIEIDADGSIRDIRMLRALGFGLDDKAIEAVTHWKFKPATRNGQPVAVSASIEINFRLL